MMPFFIIFVVFLLILHHFLRKNTRDQQAVEENFWNRERQANAARKKDISGLDYITPPLDRLPLNLNTETERQLVSLSQEKILNLTGYTNTDLKLEYGPANLETLSQCDANFTELVRLLTAYSQELIDAGQTQEARTLLEFGVSVQADSGVLYTRLADIYQASGETEKIRRLIDSANELRSISKDGIIEKLTAYLP